VSALTDQMAQSAAWLRQQQDPESGGWTGGPNDPHLSSLNTAEALIALMQADRDAVGTDAVRHGLKFLRDTQATGEPSVGAWCREHTLPDGSHVWHPDVIRTGLAVEALVLAEVPLDDLMVTRAVDWLAGVRNDDGGWGCSGKQPTRILPTCQTLLGLMAAMEAGRDLTPPIVDGIRFLLDHARKPGGYFSSNDSAGLLASPHTIYAVLVLQKGRRLGLVKGDGAERAAIGWLLRNQDAARRLVAEEFELEDRDAYTFLYVTDSLLIRVLTNSTNARDRASTLYRAALYSVKDRIEPAHGACYGYRLFSWSTSRAISAMSAAAASETDFPSRPAEYSGAKARPVLTGVMIAILGLGALLGWVGSFSAGVAGFFALIVLCVLLLNGAIGEKTFAQLVPGILKSGKGADDASGG
jgi:squalene-hopene cyclase-like protein/prenyltransferase/squalene oxidase-like repeat protein